MYTFSHIPKTGGSSIERWGKQNGYHLGKFDPFFENINHEAEYNGYSPWHRPIREYDKKVRPQPDKIFTIVRHPMTKVISAINYGVLHSPSKNEYELDYNEEFNRLVCDSLLSTDLDYTHVPQSHYIYEKDGTQYVNNILRFEYLEKDFNYFCRNIVGIPNTISTKLPIVRKTDKVFTTNHLSMQTKERIREHYKDDFQLMESLPQFS